MLQGRILIIPKKRNDHERIDMHESENTFFSRRKKRERSKNKSPSS